MRMKESLRVTSMSISYPCLTHVIRQSIMICMNKFANGDWNQFSTFYKALLLSFLIQYSPMPVKSLQRFMQENLLKTIKKLFYVL